MAPKWIIFISFFVCKNVCFAQENSTLRVVNSNVQPLGVCPAQESLTAKKDSVKAEVNQLLQNSILRNRSGSVTYPNRPCGCGGAGWTKIVNLNMTDSSQQCPSSLTSLSSPVRGCAQVGEVGACSSAFFAAGQSYSQVCGRVNAYQYGTTDAFYVSIITQYGRSIEEEYFSGVSLTHGQIGSRQHIWSFAAAISERTSGAFYDPNRSEHKCSCTDTDVTWPYRTPSFVSNDYFCDTGHLGPGHSFTTYYTNNPMWDGEGCGPTSSCCQFNNPPWFCKSLPQATTDQLELRICGSSHEKTIVYLAEIFIR